MRRPPKDGEMVVTVPGKEPFIDECKCGKFKVSYAAAEGDNRTNPPQMDSNGVMHIFDGKNCRPATREEWESRMTGMYPFS